MSLPPFFNSAEEAHAYLSAIISSSDDAIVSKDLSGTITSWNRAAEVIFGYTAAEAIGKNISLIIPPEKLHEEEFILAQIKSGEKIDHFETVRRHKQGHAVPISVTISPIKSAAGEIIGASKIARDISDRLKTEESLRALNRKKDEFLANMSHELRTPMNAVIGLTQLLMASNDLPENTRKYVQTLKISADNMLALINDLLDFAKMDSEGFELDIVDFNLATEVEKTLSVLNVRAQEKNLRLTVDFPAALNRNFSGDPLRLHQILTNLIANAIKFTNQGGVDVIFSAVPGPHPDQSLLTIRINDTGIGIAPDKREAIFEKFTQADNSITRRYGGSGLGLSIVRKCVDKMNGAITVESQPGIGSHFTVTLPLRHAGGAITPLRPTSFLAPSAAAPHKRTILLVEDHEPNILVAGEMIRHLGYDFDVAHNGVEALRKYATGEYGVILMDVQMHELDGLETTRRLRAYESRHDRTRTPIIAVTAHVTERDKEKCLHAGMDDFLPKPFALQLLGEKIARFIHTPPQSPRATSA